MNKAILYGRIGIAPKFRPAHGDVPAACSFTLATTEHHKGKPKTTWHDIVAYGKAAELIAEHFFSGSKILLSGKIDNSTYDRDGVKKFSSKIIVREFDFVDPKTDFGNDDNIGNRYD